jgi:uncharacterized OB-fold protein
VGQPAGPSDGVDTPYWEGLLRGELLIQHCECGRWVWGPTWICPSCHRFDPPWELVEPRGTIYTWTQTRHAFPVAPEFADALPYNIVLVEVPQAGNVRLLGIEVGSDPDDLPSIGDEVEGVIQPASDLTGGWAVLRWRRVDHQQKVAR